MLSYDLHLHPGPAAVPRWGTGAEIWRAARDAGVRGFVWKAHDRHTVKACSELPAEPVRAIGSASLNPWSELSDVLAALEQGALWLWGPTQDRNANTGWDLPLPSYWPQLTQALTQLTSRIVLATGHLGPDGRSAFASLAADYDHLLCSITHTLYVPTPELPRLAVCDAIFELDAYTLTVEIPGRTRSAPEAVLADLNAAGSTAYFTSDGGQAETGNPFLFATATLNELSRAIGPAAANQLGTVNPAAIVGWLDGAERP